MEQGNRRNCLLYLLQGCIGRREVRSHLRHIRHCNGSHKRQDIHLLCQGAGKRQAHHAEEHRHRCAEELQHIGHRDCKGQREHIPLVEGCIRRIKVPCGMHRRQHPHHKGRGLQDGRASGSQHRGRCGRDCWYASRHQSSQPHWSGSHDSGDRKP